MTSKSPIINFVIQEPLWEKVSSTLETSVQVALETTAHVLDKDFSNEEVSIVFSSDDDVQHLNKTFRNKDKPTNVLSFPSNELPELGDIILAYTTVLNEANALNISILHHTIHLIVHGFLHLLGYDHKHESEAHTMEQLEIEILKELNIENPYEDE